MKLMPITLREANRYVAEHHRHNWEVRGCKFCVGLMHRAAIVGVAIAGRPISRQLDDGWTLEILRTCTDGTKNANSMLYGACLRAAWALGYQRVVTYNRAGESGASLKAVGFTCVHRTKAEHWARLARPRVDLQPLQRKLRWEITR